MLFVSGSVSSTSSWTSKLITASPVSFGTQQDTEFVPFTSTVPECHFISFHLFFFSFLFCAMFCFVLLPI